MVNPNLRFIIEQTFTHSKTGTWFSRYKHVNNCLLISDNKTITRANFLQMAWCLLRNICLAIGNPINIGSRITASSDRHLHVFRNTLAICLAGTKLYSHRQFCGPQHHYITNDAQTWTTSMTSRPLGSRWHKAARILLEVSCKLHV